MKTDYLNYRNEHIRARVRQARRERKTSGVSVKEVMEELSKQLQIGVDTIRQIVYNERYGDVKINKN